MTTPSLRSLAAWLRAHPGEWRHVSSEQSNDLALDIIAARAPGFEGDGFDACWLERTPGVVDIHARFRAPGGDPLPDPLD